MLEERWVIVMPANPNSWVLIQNVQRISSKLGREVPPVYVLENMFGSVIAFVIDTTQMDEFEEASIMQALPYYDKRIVPHAP